MINARAADPFRGTKRPSEDVEGVKGEYSGSQKLRKQRQRPANYEA